MKRFLLPLLAFFLITCKKNEGVISSSNEQDDIGEFSTETSSKLDRISSVHFQLDDIILPNGETIKSYSERTSLKPSQNNLVLSIDDMEIFKQMAVRALYLTKRSNFDIREEESDPAQPNGLAYIWGGKQELTRTTPLPGSKCLKRYYGFDCAGLFQALLKAGGIGSDTYYTADQLRNPDLINSFISSNNVTSLKVKDLGNNEPNPLLTGDVVYGGYKKITDKKGNVKITYEHIGLVLKNANGSLGVFQSNGSPNFSCTENTTSGRGPRGLNLNEYKLYFSGKIGYLRFETIKDTTLEKVTVDPLTGYTNEYVSDAIKVRVVDQDKNPVKDITVLFEVKTGGGSVDFASVLTNSEGYAETKWKAGSTVGTQTVEVNAKNKDGKLIKGSPLVFSAIIQEAGDGIFIDPRDGQTYPYKTFGTQVWMTKNLNYNASGSLCYDNAADCALYGHLYDWNSAMTVAPPGWHLPNFDEWAEIENFINTHRTSPQDQVGFAALLGGYFTGFGYSYVGYQAYFWSSTPSIGPFAWFFTLSGVDGLWSGAYNGLILDQSTGQKHYLSVRCIKD